MTEHPKVPILHGGSHTILVESKPFTLNQPILLPDPSDSSIFSKTTHCIHHLTASLDLYRHFDKSHRRPSLSTIQIIKQILIDEGLPPCQPLTRPKLWLDIQNSLPTLRYLLTQLPPNTCSTPLQNFLTKNIYHPHPRKQLLGLTYDKLYNAIVSPLIHWLSNENRRRNSKRTYFSY